MIHEIFPHKFNNEFKIINPKSSDFVIRYNGSKALLKKKSESYVIPQVSELLAIEGKSIEHFEGHYLFSIDGTAFFLDDSISGKTITDSAVNAPAPEGFEYMGSRTFRSMNPVERMGGATAVHIAHWESLNKFCGKCGISPVVIVAVHNGDKLLMAHNIDNPNPRLFLISGFVEIGESLEQAVHREVQEEAGVKVKNVRYFGSQPWPFSDSLIAGFTAELDGDDTIHMQEAELSEATWVRREDIPEYETDVSISCCLIENFGRGFTLE